MNCFGNNNNVDLHVPSEKIPCAHVPYFSLAITRIILISIKESNFKLDLEKTIGSRPI